MKLWEIFRFELEHRLRRGTTLLYLAVTLLLTHGAIESIMIQEAKGSGTIHANAPFLITGSLVFISLLSLMITAALFGDAAARDVQSGIHPFFYTAPLRKRDYLGGRFLAAFSVNAILLALVPVALALAQFLYADTGWFGAFRLAAYVQPYLFCTLPTLLAVGAVLFVPAVLTRRSVAAFGGALVLFLASLLSVEFLSQRPAARTLAAMIDPFGYSAVRDVIAYWTPVERNARLIGLQGALLWNRIGWVAAGLAALAFGYRRFRFAHEGEGRRSKRPRVTASEPLPEHTAPLVVPRVAPAFGAAVRLRQTLEVARRTFGDVVASRYSLIPLALLLTLVFVGGWDSEFVYDTPTWHVTYIVARRILGELGPLICVLIALYAGEMVWREREAGASEITDAVPLPSWVALLGKFAALAGGIVVLQAIFMAAGVLLQAIRGYYDFDLPLYVQILFGFQLTQFVLWAALAMFIHVLVANKYVGHIVFVLYLAFYYFAPSMIGVEHNLLRYPATPGWQYSEMTRFAPYVAPYLAFELYWAAWALLLAVVANVFWPRGRDGGVRPRLRQAWHALTRPAATTAAVAIVFILISGGFVYYNTNVLNEYRTRDERIALQAEYERRYKKYEGLPQPRVAGSKLHVELYPERRAAEVRGTFDLVNRTAGPIANIHLVLSEEFEARSLTFDRPARAVVNDARLGYRIFALDRALQAGETVRLSFELALEPRGFPNSGIETAVLPNGSYFTHEALPVVGYQPGRELTRDATRAEYGLAGRVRPSIHDAEARRSSARNAEWFHSDIVMGTSPDEIAVTPGALHRTWTERGRRYFHYRTDAPIKNVYAFLSSAYAVREDRWRDVKLEMYYHPAHAFNVERVIEGAKASLEYLSAEFGPYPYKQLRIAEIPRHAGTFAKAFPNLVAYSEGFGFIARAEDGIDHPFAVTAHEVAHQWWGGVFAPADVPGVRVLFETLAHYSAMLVVEKTRGKEEVQRFLGIMSNRYLVGRQNRGGSEVPLLYSEDQKYIHYDKGAVAMYALRDAIGEERVNTALRRFLDKYRFAGPPYPTTLELYAELQAVTPEPMRYLLKDLFEDITIWELRTREARVEPAAADGYRVTLEVEAYKLKADSVGRDRRVPMNDFVDIAVFAPAKEGHEKGELLYLQKHRVRSGEQTITVTVPRQPASAGIDPYHRLTDRQRLDNVRDVVRRTAM